VTYVATLRRRGRAIEGMDDRSLARLRLRLYGWVDELRPGDTIALAVEDDAKGSVVARRPAA
jgi:hypothetical protein